MVETSVVRGVVHNAVFGVSAQVEGGGAAAVEVDGVGASEPQQCLFQLG